MNLVDDWCEKHKMKLSARKIVMMMLKGTLDLGRPPTIYQQGRQIKLVTELVYLGVTLESGITGVKIGKYIKEVSTRCRNLFNSLRKIAKRDWGPGYRALKIVYKGLFVAIMAYAAPTGIEMLNEKQKKNDDTSSETCTNSGNEKLSNNISRSGTGTCRSSANRTRGGKQRKILQDQERNLLLHWALEVRPEKRRK